MYAESPRHNDHIIEMMERLGIEPGGGVLPQFSLSYATALHGCDACTSKQICRDWLAHAPTLVSFAPSFCPIADIFFGLQLALPGAGYLPPEHRPLHHKRAKSS